MMLPSAFSVVFRVLVLTLLLPFAAAYGQNGDTFESDNTSTTAKLLPLGNIVQNRTLHTTFDQDWIKLSLAAGQTATVTVRGTYPRSTVLFRADTYLGVPGSPVFQTSKVFGTTAVQITITNTLPAAYDYLVRVAATTTTFPTSQSAYSVQAVASSSGGGSGGSSASGTLSITNPCTLPGPAPYTNFCSVELDVTFSNTPIACIWSTQPVQLFGCWAQGGTYSYPWVSASPSTLELRAHGAYPDTGNLSAAYSASTLLASTTVQAGSNQPPSVTLTSPANNSSFPVGQAITLSANASAPTGGISRVEFLVDGGIVGTDFSSPYSFIWTGASQGPHTVAARAIGNYGSATSPTVSISVSGVASTGALSSTGPCTLSGPASNPGYCTVGLVTEFNNTQIGCIWIKQTQTPFGCWTVGGTYDFPYATATPEILELRAHTAYPDPNNPGASYNNSTLLASTSVYGQINQPPATITLSATPSTGLTAPATTTLTAVVSGASPVLSVIYQSQGQNICNPSTAAPYACQWSQLPQGTHTVVGTATLSGGQQVTSEPMTLTVAAVQPPASCDIQLNVGTGTVESTSAVWSGCGVSSGTGVQQALYRILAFGQGSLTLSGSGYLRVGAPLYVYGGTTVQTSSSTAAARPTIIGANQQFSAGCTAGGIERDTACPIFMVEQQTPSAAAAIVFRQLSFSGQALGSHTSSAAIRVQDSANVVIDDVLLSQFPANAIALVRSSAVRVHKADVSMSYSAAVSKRQGGAAVYLFECSDCVVEDSQLSGNDYYLASDPNICDGAMGPCTPKPTCIPPAPNPTSAPCTPTMDLIAVYGSERTEVRRNVIQDGNTAGIYLSGTKKTDPNTKLEILDKRNTDIAVWGNTINRMRQHGIDVANADGNVLLERGVVLTNIVDSCGYACLSLSDAKGLTVKWNTLSRSNADANGTASFMHGALTFQCGATANLVMSNHIHGENNEATVYFDSTAYPGQYGNFCNDNELVYGNNVTANDLWRRAGRPYFDGSVGNNLTSKNIGH
jgi:hypothetical protein